MASVSNNVQLTLSDGTVGAALFQIGNGVAITHQGQSVGALSEDQLAEVSAISDSQFGAVLADKIAVKFPAPLTFAAHQLLVEAADEWRRTHTL